MDPKYTTGEQTRRDYWKRQANTAQDALLKIKGEAAAREKREREAAIRDRLAELEKASQEAQQAIKDRELLDSLIEALRPLQDTHGVKPVSWSSSTNPINRQMSITVQFARIGEVRSFRTSW